MRENILIAALAKAKAVLEQQKIDEDLRVKVIAFRCERPEYHFQEDSTAMSDDYSCTGLPLGAFL